jgi:hypothetical protein
METQKRRKKFDLRSVPEKKRKVSDTKEDSKPTEKIVDNSIWFCLLIPSSLKANKEELTDKEDEMTDEEDSQMTEPNYSVDEENTMDSFESQSSTQSFGSQKKKVKNPVAHRKRTVVQLIAPHLRSISIGENGFVFNPNWYTLVDHKYKLERLNYARSIGSVSSKMVETITLEKEQGPEKLFKTDPLYYIHKGNTEVFGITTEDIRRITGMTKQNIYFILRKCKRAYSEILDKSDAEDFLFPKVHSELKRTNTLVHKSNVVKRQYACIPVYILPLLLQIECMKANVFSRICLQLLESIRIYNLKYPSKLLTETAEQLSSNIHWTISKLEKSADLNLSRMADVHKRLDIYKKLTSDQAIAIEASKCQLEKQQKRVEDLELIVLEMQKQLGQLIGNKGYEDET